MSREWHLPSAPVFGVIHPLEQGTSSTLLKVSKCKMRNGKCGESPLCGSNVPIEPTLTEPIQLIYVFWENHGRTPKFDIFLHHYHFESRLRIFFLYMAPRRCRLVEKFLALTEEPILADGFFSDHEFFSQKWQNAPTKSYNPTFSDLLVFLHRNWFKSCWIIALSFII